MFFSLISRCNHKSTTKCSGFVWKLSRQSVGVHKIQGSNEIFRTSLIKSKHWYQPHVATLYSVLNPFDTLIQNKINTGKVCWNIYVLGKWTGRLNVLYWSSAPYCIGIHDSFVLLNLFFVDTLKLFSVIPFSLLCFTFWKHYSFIWHFHHAFT